MAERLTKEVITRKHIYYAGFLSLCVILPLLLLTRFYFVPFVLLVGAAGALVIILKPYFGLLIYSIFLFIRPQEFISALENSPIPIERSVAILLILTAILKLKRTSFRMKFTRIDYSLLAFVTAALLSVITSIWASHSFEVWIDVLRLFIIYFLIVQLIDTKRELKFYILFVIATSVFHAGASVINYYQGNLINNIAMNVDRAIGIDKSFAGPNSLAATLVYTLPFIYYFYIGEVSRRIKLFLVAIMPIMIWCIILTGSRTGMAGVLFFVILILWGNRNKVRNISIVAVMLVSIWFMMPDQYKDRFESTADLSSGTAASESARARLDGLIKGLKMVADRPLFGYGIGGYATASATIYDLGNWHQAHSLPGQILGDLGLIGTFTFVIWIFYLFKYLDRLKAAFRSSRDRFLYATVAGLRIQLLCLFFLGLAGHNLLRYNWYVISALIVVMMKPTIINSARIMHNKDSEERSEEANS